MVATVLVLCTCAASGIPAPSGSAPDAEALRAEYSRLAADGGVYALNPQRSRLRIYVFRAGAAARFGHNHVVDVPYFVGYVHLPDDSPDHARFDLRIPLESLVVDDPSSRSATGGAFASPRSQGDIEGTRSNMLGPRGLDEAQFPVVEVRSLAVEGDWPMLVADIEIRLHGALHRERAPMSVVRENDGSLRASGRLALKQTDFGIRPYAVLGGLLAVEDAVVVDFDLAAARVTAVTIKGS